MECVCVSVCVCVCVCTHVCTSGSCGVPGSPVFTDRKCLSKAKGKEPCSPAWQTLGEWPPTHTHTRVDIRKHTHLQQRKKRNLTLRGGVSGIGEVGVTGLATNCSSLPSTPAANANSGR